MAKMKVFKNSAADAFELRLGQVPRKWEFTGERFLPGLGGEIEFEHLHRYLFATQFCRGCDVLDIACGDGYGSFLLAQIAHRVCGIDIAEATIQNAREVYVSSNLHFSVGSCNAIPLQDHSVDTLVSFETIEHIADHEGFLAEVKRVLRPDGCLVISTPDNEVYLTDQSPNPFHLRELKEAEFTKLLAGCFEFVTVGRQKTIAGSAILPSVTNGNGVQIYHRGEALRFVKGYMLIGAPYMIAIASARPMPVEWGLFDDSYSARQNRLAIVGALNQEIARRDVEITSRDQAIAALNQEIARRDVEITRRDQAIAALNRKIAKLIGSLGVRLSKQVLRWGRNIKRWTGFSTG